MRLTAFSPSSQFFVYPINSIPSQKEVDLPFWGEDLSVINFHCFQGKPQDRVAGGKEEYNAFFYSLVSTDTQVGSAF